MGDLFLFDPEFKKDEAITTARGMFSIERSSVKPAKDWATLAVEITHNAPLDTLVLNFHGEEGQITVGDRVCYLDDQFVKNLFNKPPKAKVNDITFIGCNVGRGPNRMWEFAKLFEAKSVSGYTWWLVSQSFTFSFKSGAKAKEINEKLDPFKPYSVETLPATNLVENQSKKRDGHKVTVVTLCGSSNGSPSSAVPIPFVETKDHKPWTVAAPNNLKASGAAAAQEGYEGNPVPAFEKVTVTG
jgi:hypothetical protein